MSLVSDTNSCSSIENDQINKVVTNSPVTKSFCSPFEAVLINPCPLSDCVQSKRDAKNFESIQEAILIGLLSKFGSFTLLRPLKRSKVTFQTIKVESVSFSNDTININELVEQHCKQRYEMELSNGISIEKAKRRFDKNRFIFLSNLLLDLSLEFGYFFDTKMSRNTGGSIQLEKIRRTFYDNHLLFDYHEMVIRGVALNKYLFKITDNKSKKGILIQNDQTVNSILSDDITVIQRDWDVVITYLSELCCYSSSLEMSELKKPDFSSSDAIDIPIKWMESETIDIEFKVTDEKSEQPIVSNKPVSIEITGI
ncbi:TATA-binding protein-associated phosphoprotein [Entamoeba marina]